MLFQEEIKYNIGCSLSAVSQSMTYLKNIGLIKAEKGEGRKKKYSIEFSKEKIKNALEKFIFFGLNPMINFLEEKENKIGNNETKEKTKNLRKMYSGFRDKFTKLTNNLE